MRISVWRSTLGVAVPLSHLGYFFAGFLSIFILTPTSPSTLQGAFSSPSSIQDAFWLSVSIKVTKTKTMRLSVVVCFGLLIAGQWKDKDVSFHVCLGNHEINWILYDNKNMKRPVAQIIYMIAPVSESLASHYIGHTILESPCNI